MPSPLCYRYRWVIGNKATARSLYLPKLGEIGRACCLQITFEDLRHHRLRSGDNLVNISGGIVMCSQRCSIISRLMVWVQAIQLHHLDLRSRSILVRFMIYTCVPKVVLDWEHLLEGRRACRSICLILIRRGKLCGRLSHGAQLMNHGF
jgi:hypothetical protein